MIHRHNRSEIKKIIPLIPSQISSLASSRNPSSQRLLTLAFSILSVTFSYYPDDPHCADAMMLCGIL